MAKRAPTEPREMKDKKKQKGRKNDPACRFAEIREEVRGGTKVEVDGKGRKEEKKGGRKNEK